MTVRDLERSVPGLATLNHSEKIKLFAWHLHQNGKDRVDPASLRACFTELHYAPPSNISQLLTGLHTKKAKEMLKDRRGFWLEGKVRATYDTRYGDHEITVAVRHLLSDLPGKIPDGAEKRFLVEALTCFRHGAFRSAIVMTWNLAFFHLTTWIYDNHLDTFNVQLKVGDHKKYVQIKNRTDFGDLLKEFKVVEIATSAGLIDGGMKKVLMTRLEQRNIYAHPSTTDASQITAEGFIDDLINNVVLKIE